MSREIEKLLEKIYPGKSKTILENLNFKDLKEQHTAACHTDFQIYVTYPDSFSDGTKSGSFHTLAKQVGRIKGMGFDTIHVLPFLESPRIDEGFDVSDFFKVPARLGGKKGFEAFLSETEKHDVTIIMDLVINHVSEDHEWFVKAQKGEKKYRDFFIWQKTKPNLIRKRSDITGMQVTYLMNNKEVTLDVIFPDQIGEIPHYRQGSDGIWYFHTFYPQQLDLNWQNHEVYIEMTKVLIYWARRGVSFRLDAIGHIGKDISHGVVRHAPYVHDIVLSMHRILSKINPCGIFLPEVMAKREIVLEYFGKKDVESDLSYDFEMAGHIWASLLLEDKKFIEHKLTNKKKIPPWAQWVNFLRNHDELLLGVLPLGTRDELLEMLNEKTLRYKAGAQVTGRVASILDENYERVVLAHFILASLPHIPQIMYGDELGKTNDFEYMHARVREKQARTKLTVNTDARDINRGTIDSSLLSSGKKLQTEISRIFNTRAEWKFSKKWPKVEKDSRKSVLVISYELPGKTLNVFANLSGEARKLKSTGTAILSINGAELDNLPPYSGIWVVK